MIDQAWAETFARDWVEAWNAHDIERILSHYADDFEMTSPLIVERMGVPSGVLKGKHAVRSYWLRGLNASPPLQFELLGVMAGIGSLAILYRNVTRGRLVIERLELDHRRLAFRAEALYGAPLGAIPPTAP